MSKIKLSNEYALAFGRLYARTPKAVFAAVTFSYANRLFAKSQGTEVADVFLEEWKILHENGILPQQPPKSGAGR